MTSLWRSKLLWAVEKGILDIKTKEGKKERRWESGGLFARGVFENQGGQVSLSLFLGPEKTCTKPKSKFIELFC